MRKLQEWKEKRSMGSTSSGSLGLSKKAPSALGGAKRRIDHAPGGEGKKIRKEGLTNVTNSLNELSKVMSGLEKKTVQQGTFRNTPTKKQSQGDRPKFNF